MAGKRKDDGGSSRETQCRTKFYVGEDKSEGRLINKRWKGQSPILWVWKGNTSIYLVVAAEKWHRETLNRIRIGT